MIVTGLRSSKLRSLFIKAFRLNETKKISHVCCCQNIKKHHSVLQQNPYFPTARHGYLTWSYKKSTHERILNQNIVQLIRVYSTKSTNFTLRNDLFKQYVESLIKEFNNLYGNITSKEDNNRLAKLAPLKDIYDECVQLYDELSELDKLEADEEMRELAAEERETCLQNIEELEQKLYQMLIPAEQMDENDIILEVESGAGGQEAMLFAQSVYDMYVKHALYKGWEFTPLNSDQSDIGGIRAASATISGQGVYRDMKYEGGVHRVQRNPQTEKGGRIHTSTISVAILPQPTEIDIDIAAKDIRIETLGGIGPGGQAVQKSQNAVRITHFPTGMQVFCFDSRSQAQNKRMAMTVLRTRLYDKKLAEERNLVSSQRKIQVGLKNRSEKIRTYNFPQGRITDHRIGRSVFNIDQFLEGGAPLEQMVAELQGEEKNEVLNELLEQFEQNITQTQKGKQKK